MEKKTRFYLIECFTGEVICEGTDAKEVMKPATDIAVTRNCGIYRFWYEDNRLYLDAGPRLFYVIADNLEDMEKLVKQMTER